MKNVLVLLHEDVGQEARLQAALDLTRALTLRVVTATGRTGPFSFAIDDLELVPRPR